MAEPTPHSSDVSAALLVIGDEILSGRTKDKNIGYIADYLTGLGIELQQVRVVPDVESEIVEAINALRTRYTYLFTTGGIGPTHDDITADCVAKAFGVPIDIDPRARALMLERYAEGDLNAARLRMARIPAGADLIENPISKAPGFMLANVIVMAGVPAVMQAMLDNVAARLRTGAKIKIVTLDSGGLPEGIYATGLGAIAEQHPNVSIGSYPSFHAGGFTNQIVLRSKDSEALAGAEAEVRNYILGLVADKAPI